MIKYMVNCIYIVYRIEKHTTYRVEGHYVKSRKKKWHDSGF